MPLKPIILLMFIASFGLRVNSFIYKSINDQFQNSFDSIAKKEEMAKEQNVFDEMKGELMNAQKRNTQKKRNFFTNINTDENVVIKREAGRREKKNTTPKGRIRPYSHPIIPIMDVEAFISTSRQTTTKSSIATHKTTATTHMVDHTAVDGESNVTEKVERKIPSRPSRREKRKELFDRMVAELGENDENKILQLTNAPDTFYRNMNNCFNAAYETFVRFCYQPFVSGGLKYFKPLLSLACDAEWLDTEKICVIVRHNCQPELFGPIS